MLVNPVIGQIKLLLLSFVLGTAIGLLYDIVRAQRRRAGAAMGAVLDAVFAVTAALLVFWFGMGPGDGVVQLFTAIFTVLGFAAYMAFLSPGVLKGLLFVLNAADKAAYKASAPLRRWGIAGKTKKISKNVFTKLKEWFTITTVIMSSVRAH